MDPGTGSVGGLSVSSRSERGYVIAALSGELDIACAPALREKLLGSLRPAASRLVIDLSRVSYADASGLAVLVGTGRRAGLLGGFLRLAAPTAAVDTVLRITGLHRQLDIFPTVQAAITSPGVASAALTARRPRAKTPPPARCTPGGPGAPPTLLSSARQSPPCSCTPARGVTPTPAAGLLPPCTPWPAPTPAPATPL
jgi:anti-anti-sigma factor